MQFDRLAALLDLAIVFTLKSLGISWTSETNFSSAIQNNIFKKETKRQKKIMTHTNKLEREALQSDALALRRNFGLSNRIRSINLVA